MPSIYGHPHCCGVKCLYFDSARPNKQQIDALVARADEEAPSKLHEITLTDAQLGAERADREATVAVILGHGFKPVARFENPTGRMVNVFHRLVITEAYRTSGFRTHTIRQIPGCADVSLPGEPPVIRTVADNRVVVAATFFRNDYRSGPGGMYSTREAADRKNNGNRTNVVRVEVKSDGNIVETIEW